MFKLCRISLFILIISNTAFAGDMGTISSPADRGFFVGLGGGYNSVTLQNQVIYGKGVNTAYLGPITTSSGSAAGYSNPFNDNQNALAPYAQIGYFRHFSDHSFFWGTKFSYDYLNTRLSNNNTTIAQAGSNYNYITHVTTNFTGNYVIESSQTRVNHELLLLAFLGQSFNHANLYIGAGPSVFGTQSNIYQLTGYADYDGVPGTDISGLPVNLSKSSWVWGGAAQLGLSYLFNPSWFLDFNYTYAISGQNTIKYVSPFTNQITLANLIGTSYINPSQQFAVQNFTISVNKVF